MRGRVCLVTGGSSGVGRATATGLAALGATVLMGRVTRNAGSAPPSRSAAALATPMCISCPATFRCNGRCGAWPGKLAGTSGRFDS